MGYYHNGRLSQNSLQMPLGEEDPQSGSRKRYFFACLFAAQIFLNNLFLINNFLIFFHRKFTLLMQFLPSVGFKKHFTI